MSEVESIMKLSGTRTDYTFHLARATRVSNSRDKETHISINEIPYPEKGGKYQVLIGYCKSNGGNLSKSGNNILFVSSNQES